MYVSTGHQQRISLTMDFVHSLQHTDVSNNTVIYSRRMYGTERLLAAFAYVATFAVWLLYSITVFPDYISGNFIESTSMAVATSFLGVRCLSRIGACPAPSSWNLQRRRGSELGLTRLGLRIERLEIPCCRIHGFSHTRLHQTHSVLLKSYDPGQRKQFCGETKSVRWLSGKKSLKMVTGSRVIIISMLNCTWGRLTPLGATL